MDGSLARPLRSSWSQQKHDEDEEAAAAVALHGSSRHGTALIRNMIGCRRDRTVAV